MVPFTAFDWRRVVAMLLGALALCWAAAVNGGPFLHPDSIGYVRGPDVAVMKLVGLPHEKVNVHGGAVALGHPLGASGARLVTTALSQLMKTGGKYALCTMCIGVGQGIATLIERC